MRLGTLLILLLFVLSGCSAGGGAVSLQPSDELRLGYMANLTHAQAVLGMADGSLERSSGVKVRAKLFPSGPSAMTALFAGEIDVLYIGPSPAVNGYIRSGGKALKVVAGAASGGAVLVLQPGVDLGRLHGTRLATPGVANTQDIALRHFLDERGLRTRERGGAVSVTPLPPAEIFGLFSRGQIDGAWVPEPWGARLVQEAGGRIAIDERDRWPDGRFATTLVVVRTAYLEANRATALRFLEQHVALTRWIDEHPDEARVQLQAALAGLQGKPLPDALLAEALWRIDFVYDPMADSVAAQADHAYRLGLLGARPPDLSGLFDLSLLEEVAP